MTLETEHKAENVAQRTVYYVESADGSRLTEDFDVIDKAREYAEETRQRLMEDVINETGEASTDAASFGITPDTSTEKSDHGDQAQRR